MASHLIFLTKVRIRGSFESRTSCTNACACAGIICSSVILFLCKYVSRSWSTALLYAICSVVLELILELASARDLALSNTQAGERLVEIVLVLRLLGLDDFGRGLAGHEFCAPALGQVAGEFGVPIILELLDLVRRPALRHADECVGDRAFGEVVELPELEAMTHPGDALIPPPGANRAQCHAQLVMTRPR